MSARFIMFLVDIRADTNEAIFLTCKTCNSCDCCKWELEQLLPQLIFVYLIRFKLL